MNIDEIFEEIAASKGWKFLIGNRSDVNRLESTNDDLAEKTGLFLEPPTLEATPGQYGGIASETWTGHFILVDLAPFDAGTAAEDGADYTQDKYRGGVDLLFDELRYLARTLSCGYELDVIRLKAMPFFNLLSWNGDGISVEFTVKNPNP